MKFVKREMEPHVVKVAGGEYPAIFNYRAIIDAQSDLKEWNVSAIPLFLESQYDDYGNLKRNSEGNYVIPVSHEVILTLLFHMMRAAGVEVEKEDLFASVLPSEEPSLIVQMRNIINAQGMETEKEESPKNAKTRATTKK